MDTPRQYYEKNSSSDVEGMKQERTAAIGEAVVLIHHSYEGAFGSSQSTAQQSEPAVQQNYNFYSPIESIANGRFNGQTLSASVGQSTYPLAQNEAVEPLDGPEAIQQRQVDEARYKAAEARNEDA